MEAGLIEIIRSLNRSWIDDAYFSLYRPIHPGRKVRGEMSGYPMARLLSVTWAILACLVFSKDKT